MRLACHCVRVSRRFVHQHLVPVPLCAPPDLHPLSRARIRSPMSPARNGHPPRSPSVPRPLLSPSRPAGSVAVTSRGPMSPPRTPMQAGKVPQKCLWCGGVVVWVGLLRLTRCLQAHVAIRRCCRSRVRAEFCHPPDGVCGGVCAGVCVDVCVDVMVVCVCAAGAGT